MKKIFLAIFILTGFLFLGARDIKAAYTCTGGGDHEGASWTPATDCPGGIAGTHTNISTMTVSAGQTATVQAYNGSSFGVLTVTATTITIENTGTLTANTKGFLGGTTSYGAGGGTGGGTAACCNNGTSGGGYGGVGGKGQTGSAGAAYGSLTAPVDKGSGGAGGANMTGGAGGGAIRLTATGTMTVSGTITANGGNGTIGAFESYSGGGSGGSIYLTADTFAGSGGSLTANGGSSAGSGVDTGGGGAGGRISVVYTNSYTYSGSFAVDPGSSGITAAEYGTSIVRNTNTNDLLVPSRNSNWYAGDLSSWDFRNLTINGTVAFVPTSATLLTINSSGTTTIASGITITLPGSYSTGTNGVGVRMNLTGDVTVPSSTTITANTRGYAGGNSGYGNGVGSGAASGACCNNAQSGGGYGGAGKKGTHGTPGGTYGSSTTPTDLGSGGAGSNTQRGGYGGGAIRISTTGTLTVTGTISSNGENGLGSSGTASGAGSGGSVYLTANTLTGGGSITANGGNGSGSAGGGGGGRIRIIYVASNTFSGTLTANVGSGGTGGGNGTISTAQETAPNTPSSLGSVSVVKGNYINDNTPTLSFTLSDINGSQQVKYQIQVGSNPDFSSLVVDYTSALGTQGSKSFTVGQAAGSGSYTTGAESQTLSDGDYYWRVKAIDENAGVSDYALASSCSAGFCDYSGLLNSLTFQADATTGTGKYGVGFSFDGTLDRIDLDSISGMPTSTSGDTEVSIVAWVNATTLGATKRNIISAEDSGQSWAIYNTSGNPGKLTYTVDGGTNSGLSAATLSTSTWYHIVVTGGVNGTRLYINGQLDSQTSFSGTLPSIQTVTLGAAYSGSDAWTGKIDEFRIYNKELNAGEIKSLYDWAPGPVGHWSLDEKTGTSPKDSSANDLSTSIVGTSTWTKGKFGGAIGFDGSNSNYVEITNDPVLTPTGAITIESWVYRNNSTNVSGAAVLCKGVGSGGETYCLDFPSANSLTPRFYFYSGATPYTVTASSSISATTWTHLAGVFDGSNLFIYINGVLSNSASGPSTLSVNSHSLTIGCRETTTTYDKCLDAKLDDVIVYDYARTQKQIVSDMNAGHPSVGSPVGSALGYWKFDEGADNTCLGGTNDACNSGNGGSTLDGAQSGMAVPATATSGWTNNGKFVKALIFDDTNDYVDVGSSSVLNFGSGDFTYSAWVKTGDTGSIRRIIAQDNNSTNHRALTVHSTDKVQFWCRDSSNNAITATSTTTITDGNWHHVVGVRSGTTGYIYVDGRQESSAINASTGSCDGGTSTTIGARVVSGTPGLLFDGTIDEVKIYNFALTADEVKLDYNRGSSIVLGTEDTGSKFTDGAGNPSVAYWNFNEKAGTNTYDTSGSGITGVLGADGAGTDIPKWVKGKTGSALNFDGSDDFVQMPDNSNLSSANKTIEFWINKSNSTDRYVLAKATTSKWEYGITVSTVVQATTYQCAGSNHAQVTGTTAINDGQWHHVAVVQSDNSYLRIYIDGKQDANSTSFTGSQCDSDDVFYVGRRFDGFNINAHIDDIKIFNYARTPAQVAFDYNRGAPVGWWKFDECQGTTAYDSSPNADGGFNGNNGTINPGDTSGDNDTVGSCNSGTTTEMWNDGTTGKRNASLGFDGTNDYVSNSTKVEPSNISLSAWVKPSNIGNASDSDGNRRTIINNFYFSAGAYGYSLDIAAQKFRVYFGTSAGTPAIGNTTPVTEQWYHVVGTYDGTVKRLYVNGVLESSVNDTNGQRYHASSVQRIGINGQISNDEFAGLIDDVRIYNYALSAAQVKEIMNDGTVFFGD